MNFLNYNIQDLSALMQILVPTIGAVFVTVKWGLKKSIGKAIEDYFSDDIKSKMHKFDNDLQDQIHKNKEIGKSINRLIDLLIANEDVTIDTEKLQKIRNDVFDILTTNREDKSEILKELLHRLNQQN